MYDAMKVPAGPIGTVVPIRAVVLSVLKAAEGLLYALTVPLLRTALLTPLFTP